MKVVCKNDLIDEANALDAAEVMRDAEGVQLAESVEVCEISERNEGCGGRYRQSFLKKRHAVV